MYRRQSYSPISFENNVSKPVINVSVLPNFNNLTTEKVEHTHGENGGIVSLIRKLNPNKASGSVGISGQMRLLCVDSVILPIRIIFTNIVSTAIYLDMWKLANVTPIFKKGDIQLIKNYRQISILSMCGKMFEKIIFNHLYSHLTTHHLITKNQPGFRPGDSTTNQLIDHVN